MAMNLPFYMNETFGYEIGLVLVTVIGVLFGFTLERSGFGRARILAAQFYFTDMRVLKVMFSAVVTAALGLAILGGFGLVELGAITVPSAHLWPMVVGGLILGAGFVTCGYCPGTAVVATASGNVDAAAGLGGMLVGSLAFGWAYPLVADFYNGSALDEILIHDLIGIPQAVIVLAVVLMAIGAFLGGEKLEEIFARRNKSEIPAGSTGVRNRVFIGFGLAAALALVTMMFEADTATAQMSKNTTSTDSATLAQTLIEEPNRIILVDLRANSDCMTKTVPGAMCIPEEGVTGDFFAAMPATRTLVVFTDNGELGVMAPVVAHFPGPVEVLDGGFPTFREQILTEPTPPENPTAATLTEYRMFGALHAHFTGAKVAVKPIEIKAVTVKREIKKGGGC
jgi:hypothetical protein